MSVIYVPPDNSGFDRLFQFSMAVRRAREAKEEMLARQEHDKSMQDRQWGREDSLLEAERSRGANLAQRIFGGEAPSFDKSSIPEAPMTSNAFGGFADLMEKQYAPGLPKDFSDLYQRSVNTGATLQDLKFVSDLLTQITGTQRAWDGADNFTNTALQEGRGSMSYVPQFNPGGVSTNVADPLKLSSDESRARISAAPQHGANAVRARELALEKEKFGLYGEATLDKLNSETGFNNARALDLKENLPSSQAELPSAAEVYSATREPLPVSVFLSSTIEGRRIDALLKTNNTSSELMKNPGQLAQFISEFTGIPVVPDPVPALSSPAVIPGLTQDITAEDLQEADRKRQEADRRRQVGGGGGAK